MLTLRRVITELFGKYCFESTNFQIIAAFTSSESQLYGHDQPNDKITVLHISILK